MAKTIKAIYEKGLIRPLQPLDLPDGSRLDVIIIRDEQPKTDRNVAEILAEIASLPLEGPSDAFTGSEHDSVLYPQK